MRSFLCVLFFLSALPVAAEDVPPWVAGKCSGTSDIHRLEPSQVHFLREGIRIDGYRDIVPYSRMEISQDDHDYAFYSEYKNDAGQVQWQSTMYCLFIVPGGV